MNFKTELLRSGRPGRVFFVAIVLIAALPWFGVLATPAHSLFEVGTAMMASCVFVLILFIFKSLFVDFRASLDSLSKVIWALLILAICGIQVLNSPGMISGDDLYLLEAMSYGRPSEWHSFAYSFLQEALILVFHKPFGMAYFNIVVFSVLTAQCLEIVQHSKWRFWRVILALILISPISQIVVIFQNRDTTFTLLFLAIFFEFIRHEKARRSWSQLELLALSVIVGFTSCLRPDGLIVAIGAMFAMVVLIQAKRVWRVQAATCIAGVWLALTMGPQPLYTRPGDHDGYALTLFVNPLSFILHARGETLLSSDERRELERYFKVDYLVKYYNPYDIDPFRDGGIKSNTTHDDFLAFRATAIRCVLREPGLWLENRIGLMKRMLGLSPGTDFFHNARYANDPKSLETFKNGKARFGYSAFDQRPSPLEQKYYDFLTQETSGHSGLWHWIFETGLVPSFALILGLLLYLRWASVSLFAATCVVRMIAVFAVTPAAYFKYAASLWLGGWILVVLILANLPYLFGSRKPIT